MGWCSISRAEGLSGKFTGPTAAVQYGNGESEKNLGRVLRNLKATNVVVGTKVRLPSAEFGRMADAVAMSLEGSLCQACNTRSLASYGDRRWLICERSL